MRHRLGLAMLLLAACSLWWPLPLQGWQALVAEAKAGLSLTLHEPVLVTIAERLAWFMPLGFLVHRSLPARGRRALLVGSGLVVLFALMLELAQLPLASRHARLGDVLIAGLSGVAGCLVSLWLGERPDAAKIRSLLLALLVLGNALVTLAIVESHRGAEARDWDCGYPLLIGNEASLDRPWLGRIRRLAIYAEALSAGEVQDLQHAGPTTMLPGALARFDFGVVEGGRIPNQLDGPDLLLPPADEGSWGSRDGALELRRPLLIETGPGARTLCETIAKSGRFSIEIVLATGPPGQNGPARIVSLSADTLNRNFTLGQEFEALVFRVRTPATGANGVRLEARAPNALNDQRWHHVVASHGHGNSTLFVDGREVRSMHRYRRMVLSETNIVRLALPVVAGLAVTGGIAALLVPPGSLWRRYVLVWSSATLVPAAATLMVGPWFGHELDLALIIAVVVGPALGFAALESLRWLAGVRSRFHRLG